MSHRKPTTMKLLDGNPGKTAVNEHEPEFISVSRDAPPPAILKGAAADEWRDIVPQLADAGLLLAVDARALAAYCRAFATWKDAQEHLDKEGAVIKVKRKNGEKAPVINPYFNVATRASTEMRTFMMEFGMTPASRTKLQVPKKGEKKGEGWQRFAK